MRAEVGAAILGAFIGALVSGVLLFIVTERTIEISMKQHKENLEVSSKQHKKSIEKATRQLKTSIESAMRLHVDLQREELFKEVVLKYGNSVQVWRGMRDEVNREKWDLLTNYSAISSMLGVEEVAFQVSVLHGIADPDMFDTYDSFLSTYEPRMRKLLKAMSMSLLAGNTKPAVDPKP